MIQKSDVFHYNKNIASGNGQSGYGNLLRCESCWRLATSDMRSARGRLLQALTSDFTPCADSACYRRYRIQKFGGALEKSGRVFLHQDLYGKSDRVRCMFGFFDL